MNGLLLVDKPGGMTSHDVVARVRRAAQEKSIGHLGTLDPMADRPPAPGAGKYTRLAQFFGSLEKHYTGTIRFGFATDTYDAEGKPSSPPRSVSLTLDDVRVAAAAFLGTTEQMPPPFSAKKVDGKTAYTLAPRRHCAAVEARAGDHRELHHRCAGRRPWPASPCRFPPAATCARSRMSWGSGWAAVRTLASLRRIAAGAFTVEQALPPWRRRTARRGASGSHAASANPATLAAERYR